MFVTRATRKRRAPARRASEADRFVGAERNRNGSARRRTVRAGRPHRRHRRRSGRTHCGLSDGQDGMAGDGPRSRRHARRHLAHRAVQGLPLRHRRPPLLHQDRAGRGAVARDPRRRVHLGAAPVAHPLQRQVLRLPAQGRQRPGRARPDQRRAHLRQLPVVALPPLSGRRELRAVGHQPVRQAAFRDLLQDLHREGVGHSVHRDPGGMGGAAHPGAVARQGHPERHRPQPPLERHQDAHQRVPVSAPRPRPDVGDGGQAHRGPGRHGADEALRHGHRARQRARHGGAGRDPRGRAPLRGRALHFHHAGPLPGARARSARARTR